MTPDRQRSQVVREALETLEQQVEAIQDSDTFRAYLDTQARFHHYSFNNTLLIMAQRPDATRVAGFETWKSMKRFVKKGEKGIRIIAPVFHKRMEWYENSDETDVQRTIFRAARVFDISQTEGEPLPEVSVPILEDDSGVFLYNQMRQVAECEKVKLYVNGPSFDRNPQMMGYYSPTERLIALREAPQLQMTKTLAHELTHFNARHQTSTPETETEAESVSYVVLKHFGLDSGERCFPYVATWAQDKRVLRSALSNVQHLSHQLIDQIGLI